MNFGAFIEMIKTGFNKLSWGKVAEHAPTVIDQKETKPLEALIKEAQPAEAPVLKKDEKGKKPTAVTPSPKKKRKRKRSPRRR